MANITVLGAGGWGLGLALAAHRNANQVTVWSCFEQEIEELKREREHVKLLPGVPIPSDIEFTTDLTLAAKADGIVFAVPSPYIRSTAQQIKPYVAKASVLIDASKGIEKGTGYRMSQIIEEVIPGCPVVAFSGPTHAEEVARGLPTSIVSASPDLEAARWVQDVFMQPSLRVYVNPDIIGVELGGALKNVIALASGISDGLNMGDNCKAALMTRGIAEMARLGESLGAKTETFLGLAGIGDLIVTCGSVYSRNHRAGELIGKGIAPQTAVEMVGTVEGFFAVASAYELAQKQGVELPITEECYRVCYENASPKLAVENLMGRKKRQE
ncbi:MAG: NAD(P)-dependent glycerol-3-phosphate dehydrogenase [Clostridia bacterium]|nr:NAD(P)-dependent glycerol-3-phosphate dehydrogenase [Clostridia bacterium]